LVENDPGPSVRRLANELEDGILCLDDFEVVAGLSRMGADISFLRTIRSLIDEQNPLILLLLEESYMQRLVATKSGLEEDIEAVPVHQLDPAVLDTVVNATCSELEDLHGVTIPESVRQLAIDAPPVDKEFVHPGLAISRLDNACVRARIAGRTIVEAEDLDHVETPAGQSVDNGLATRLINRVKGQDSAVLRMVKRLMLTRRGLDLRPARPDGVFLLVGPTGVGKTELAKALAAELMGDESLMIRLDMSEYSQEWSLSRLIGPAPGYVGSTEPDSWLTTKVINQPDAVILLDEFEKSDPQVWNTFLQVFDDGRLTDSLGRTVDFSRTIFLLTSNLGARSATKEPIGFTNTSYDQHAADQRLLGSIQAEIPPELLNRMDDVLIFHSLASETILEVCHQLVEGLIVRCQEQGIQLDVDPEVERFLSTVEYDPRFGARHLQRNIEALLLQPMIGAPEKSFHVRVVDSHLSWTSA
jgi:energy-coupling factor transporter ATP-binding protein EcfA2